MKTKPSLPQIKKTVMVSIYTITNLHIIGEMTITTPYDHIRLAELVKLSDREKSGFIVLENVKTYRAGAVETLINEDKSCAVSVYSICKISLYEKK